MVDELLLMGSRLVIATAMWKEVLSPIQRSHLGVNGCDDVHMKQRIGPECVRTLLMLFYSVKCADC